MPRAPSLVALYGSSKQASEGHIVSHSERQKERDGSTLSAADQHNSEAW